MGDSADIFNYRRNQRVCIFDVTATKPIMHLFGWHGSDNVMRTRCGKPVKRVPTATWGVVVLPVKHAGQFCLPCSKCQSMMR